MYKKKRKITSLLRFETTFLPNPIRDLAYSSSRSDFPIKLLSLGRYPWKIKSASSHVKLSQQAFQHIRTSTTSNLIISFKEPYVKKLK